MKTTFSALIVCAASLLGLPAAQAATVSLFNTGVDATGAVLPDSTVGDAHYSLISTPGGTSDVRVISSASGFPIGPWLGDNSSSRWIGPNNDAQLNGNVGAFVYRATFDLTGLNAASALINGLWTTDNNGLDILINGVGLGYTTAGGQFAAGFAAFQVTSGFVAGINTLDFVVNNGGGPTGLRVEMTGNADLQQAVPEPGSLALVGLAIAGLGVARRRKA